MKLPTIMAICGSTRVASTNLNLIKAISELYQSKLSIKLFEGLSEIPHFNPDLDNDLPPEAVVDFRHQLMMADGILICTPEYAMGVPGSLKNAIDWTVSSMEFSRKPTVLITASSLGEKGHASLLETLKIIEADINEETQLVISYVKTKVKSTTITDVTTLQEVNKVMEAFVKKIRPNSQPE
ncbi:MAG: NAD(P)H-dependent oxidoreductase [Cyclobacteriaceae bacterium]|nr:NAD(P)H-dependent oxidoreductase [Cyclobacteriaceae bacterium]